MAARFGITQVTHRWSTHDGVTIDMLPYAGTARRGSERIYTATGFGKWGMTNGTAAALVVSDAILGRRNEFTSLFDPHRVTVKASASRFAREKPEGRPALVRRSRQASTRGSFRPAGTGAGRR
jgi:glycine/D-amino acid oxidase-like deaminating enzyme